MSKYNLSELLTEVAGGRIGTLNISARDLVNKMEDLEDKGVRVERFDGLSADGKTYIEFHVHPIRKYDEDYSFSVYDFKFGFDPMSPEHADEEYSFSVGGRPSALENAETTLRGGDMGYQINEDEFDEARQSAIESSQEKAGMNEDLEQAKKDAIKDVKDFAARSAANMKIYMDALMKYDIGSPEVEKAKLATEKGLEDLGKELKENMGMTKKDALKKEMMIHVDQLIDGNIDMNDFMNVVEDIMAEANSMEEVMGVDRKGNKKPDTDGSDATKFKKAAMSEAKYAPEVEDRIKMVKKVLSKTSKFSQMEIETYVKSLLRDFDKGHFEDFDDYKADDYIEDMNNYIADKALQEHFKRFI